MAAAISGTVYSRVPSRSKITNFFISKLRKYELISKIGSTQFKITDLHVRKSCAWHGIKVQMLEDYDVDSTGGIELRPMYSEEDVLTDESEYFHIRNSGFSRETLSIGFSDIDGEENGGEFAVKVVTVITCQ